MDDTVTGVKLATALEPDPAPGQPRRRGWIKWAVAVALALIAILAFQHYENIAPSTEDSRNGAKPAGPPPQSVGAATIAAVMPNQARPATSVGATKARQSGFSSERAA